MSACAPSESGTNDAGTDAAIFADAASGSGSLLIEGTFVVDNSSNILDGTALRVDCELSITRDGEPVEDAQVTVNPAPPAFQTLLIGEELDASHYVGWYLAYAETARLTVSAGDDFLSETLLVGPALFQIESPELNGSVPVSHDFEVRWSRPDGALDWADVETSAFSARVVEDSGALTIPADALEMEGDDAAIVSRWRENSLEPGAQPGSHILFAARSAQPFTIE